MQIVNITYKS